MILSLQNITVHRDNSVILRDLNWQVRAGEHWALLGANGSGKTTLLKVITGYEWPTDGTVEVLGEQFGQVDLRDLRKLIGLVSSSLVHWFPGEQTGLDVAVSGLEASIGLWREFTPDEIEMGRRALELISAGDIAAKPYRVLSQGERQRVMIARALVHQPSLLVLDEPCSGLDPLSRETFLHDLSQFARQPDAPTLIFVTHHIEEIPGFVTHALALKKGEVLARGPIEQVCNSEVLGKAFDCQCEVRQTDRRYQLRVLSAEQLGAHISFD